MNDGELNTNSFVCANHLFPVIIIFGGEPFSFQPRIDFDELSSQQR